MVSADPIRMFLYRWMIETGDPVEVIARGFNLDAKLVAGVIDGSVRSFSAAEEGRLSVLLAIGDGFPSDAGMPGRCSTPTGRAGFPLSRPSGR